MKILFDVETNGYLRDATNMWCLCATDVVTKKTYDFKEGDLEWQYMMKHAETVIGHHILGYDLLILEKLFKFKISKNTGVVDTLLLSRILDYKRFGEQNHSLETWGEFLGFPKDLFSDFSKYSDELFNRCKVDVQLNAQVYEVLLDELKTRKRVDSRIITYIKAEHAAARWNGQAELHGWPFDLDGANKLYEKISEVVDAATNKLTPLLGTKTVPTDKVGGVVQEKVPKWNADGSYHSNVAKYFGIDPWSGYEGEERLVEGPYCRLSFVPLSLSSVQDVKIFLNRNGWVPTEWNTKRDPVTNKSVKTSPKITEDSLEFLGGDGKLYSEYTVAKSRQSILKGLIENADEQGRVHGSAHLIGTPSMRATHTIVVNMPSAEAEWGPEFRKLFKTKPGWKIIGADSSGNQARGLAHYLGDEKYIDTLLNGDVHQFNADILTGICRKLLNRPEFVVTRAQAKRILYAFLFGASGQKLWSYIFSSMDEKQGNLLKNGFVIAVPGFLTLLDSLKEQFKDTKKYGYGYILSIAGVVIYVDSMHKLLVYLLQSCEKATCSAAIMLIMQKLEEENIPYEPYIYYHDEVEFAVPEEYAERAKEIGKWGFREGPRLYGIEIMDGDAKVGDTWYDVH